MGSGIAITHADTGIPVLHHKDIGHAALARGMATIRRDYESAASKGRMTAETVKPTMLRIWPVMTYGQFDG